MARLSHEKLILYCVLAPISCACAFTATDCTVSTVHYAYPDVLWRIFVKGYRRYAYTYTSSSIMRPNEQRHHPPFPVK